MLWMKILNKILANWSAPSRVQALTTLRSNGFSKPPYESNNLASHVNDDINTVIANRNKMKAYLGLPREPDWLEQTHSNDCVVVEEELCRKADAAITRMTNRVLAILTADCVPILLSSKKGDEIAAIHAGWRGLLSGIIENTLSKLLTASQEIIAWVGPAICQSCYEVGEDVYEACLAQYSFASIAFLRENRKWRFNLPQLTELVLRDLGINLIYKSNNCTFEQKEYFYSYRRAAQTGRMATLIWINEQQEERL